MEEHGVQRPLQASLTEEDSSISALWDWNDLLDFTVDDSLDLPLHADQIELDPLPEPPPEEAAPAPAPAPALTFANSDRVRKRDPRLTCSNFLAGRIPCACPEIDAKMAEEDEQMVAGLRGKKRARTARAPSGHARCQVPGCEVDISELKGYHKRHRVCLRCANSNFVLLDGERKRYCQQCGKFHVLPDFDEGKRSCRRKLEKHNDRRRRKSVDSKAAVDKEPAGSLQSEDVACDGEEGKDGSCNNQIVNQEAFFESEDGHVSAHQSAPNSQNVNSDSGLSFAASGDTQTDGGKDDSKNSHSPSYCDNKSAYSSMCPTGRISFKLYDWNPAEFPRRLRLQIFEWLANMPVELEGYIRPGCTILTVFIAMPKIMWVKLFEDPVTYVHDFVVAPGRMLSGRGSIIVHLNNKIFHVKDGISVTKVNVEVQAPRLHYVHPTCFEAGKPMEFVACGSNLLQPKLRFLISFAGKYLDYDYSVESPHGPSKGDPITFGHQLYKINVLHTEPNIFGPAFIEVENESGLSNFIPVLIGEKEICCEVKLMQHRFEASLFPERSQFVDCGSLSDLCGVSAFRQIASTELLLDIAWLLKGPGSESFRGMMSSSQVQRFRSLLNFLINNESTIILEKLLQNLKMLMDNVELNSVVNGTTDANLGLLLKYMDFAEDILHKKLEKKGALMQNPRNIVPKTSSDSQYCSESNILVPLANQDLEAAPRDKLGIMVDHTCLERSEIDPLLNGEVVMNVSLNKEWPRKSCGQIISGKVFSSRSTVFVVTFATVCFGICVVVLHPHTVNNFTVSIRRTLFGKS